MRRLSVITAVLLLLLLPSCKGKKGGEQVQEPVQEPLQEETAAEDLDRGRAFVDFLYSISNLSTQKAGQKMEEWFDRYAADTLMLSTVRSYLYDPNSPYRSEDLYLFFVSRAAVSEQIPEDMRSTYEEEKRVCAMNRTGSQVADFEFVTTRDEKLRLFDINSEFTLLFFSNPGCPACAEITQYLTENPVIIQAQANGLLSVVNVYIDEDLAAWREYSKEYPEYWYSGYDPHMILRQNSIFCVRAIPSLYLLDYMKRVVLKDAPIENVLNYLVPVLQEEVI